VRERPPVGVSHGSESEENVADPLAVDSATGARNDQMPRGFTRTRGAQPSVEFRVMGPRSLISHELSYRLKTVCFLDPKTRSSKLDEEPQHKSCYTVIASVMKRDLITGSQCACYVQIRVRWEGMPKVVRRVAGTRMRNNSRWSRARKRGDLGVAVKVLCQRYLQLRMSHRAWLCTFTSELLYCYNTLTHIIEVEY
jgi:hypothetical protein